MDLNFKFIPIVLCALGFGALTIGAQAQTTITEQTSYFTIEGSTADELDQALMRRGPLSETSGTTHPGITKIHFGGDVTLLTTERNCRIDRINVTLSTHIELPRWKNRRTANSELGISWDALSSDIKRHEERHAQIARQYAKALDVALAKITPAKTCAQLQQKISKTTQKLIRKHDAEQARFDVIEAQTFDTRLERILRQNRKIAAE